MIPAGATWLAASLRLFILVALLAMPAVPRTALAQFDQPPVMPVVLADLSERVGQPVTVQDFDDWRWSQRTYEDASLGCPQPGEEYEAEPTTGYRILIWYRGATYDYRVTRNGALVTLCMLGSVQESGAPTATPAGSPTPTALPTVIPPTPTPLPGREVCAGALLARLAVGQSAQVASRNPSPLRAAPDTTSTVLAQIEPGQPVRIVGGPECGEQLVWWQVDHQMIVGWMQEGHNEVYWLEPLSDTPTHPAPTPGPSPTPRPHAAVDLPPGRQPITLANAPRLAPFVERGLDGAAGALAWSSDGFALAVAGEQGIWLFAAENLSASPRLLRAGTGPVLDVAFSPAPGAEVMLSAHDDGAIRLWDVALGGQIAVLAEHDAPVRALAFNADGSRLASAGGSLILLWDLAASGSVGRFEGHTGDVRALAYSPDGTLLASGGDDRTIRLWDLISATPLAVLEGHSAPVLDLAFSPDAAWIASGSEDGTLRLWDSASGGSITLAEHDTPVHAVAFAPAGNLLVAGIDGSESQPPALELWDIAERAQLGVVTLPEGERGAPADLLFGEEGAALAWLTTQTERSALRIWGVSGAE